MSKDWQIAQLNIARARYPEDDKRMHHFYAQLDEINALADVSQGFVWRLQSETGNATDIKVDDDPLLIVNMSVWESVESLFDFAYKTAHREVLANRRDWFSRPEGAYQVLWWVESGHRPAIEEGMARLNRLREDGPTKEAFSFKSKFPPPDRPGIPENMKPDPFCSGWE